ncbi:MAG: hypothetical protein EOP07_19630 [Proteobacteria bacterium]|nr:MAG: hypothetical protein EOP07_19630 [Pseudomonadota bacterium]
MKRKSLSKFLAFTFILSSSCSKPPSVDHLFREKSDDAGGVVKEPYEEGTEEGEGGEVIVSGPETGTGTEADPSANLPAGFLPNMLSMTVTNSSGAAPKKGDALKVTVKFENKGAKSGELKLNPFLTGSRFTDFENVPLSTVSNSLKGGEKKDIVFEIPNLIENPANSMRFALSRGGYKLNVQMEFEGKKVDMTKPQEFEIAKGPGVFTLVLYDKRYFTIGGAKGQDAEKWVVETMTRKGSVYDQNSKTKKIYAGGFDEMMGVKHIVKGVDQLDSTDDGSDVFDKPEALATKWLGLSKKWDHGSGPGTNKHGYDYFIALDYDYWGGVAFGAAQVSGIGDETKDRMQVILVHESGHVFGAPHCDPIQGYVMCSGEKHEDYKKSGEFVWLDDSRNAMKNIFE